MPPFRDITNQQFGWLTALRAQRRADAYGYEWVFACRCGKEVVYRGDLVRDGNIISCGCHRQQTRKFTTPRICVLCGKESIKKNEHGYIGGVCQKCCNSSVTRWRKNNPIHQLLISARQRAKKWNVPCTIKVSDLTVPETCPVLGIPLRFGTVADREHSPSLDRIIPALGYVPGNVAIISFRANRFKNDASAAELRAIADWIDKNAPVQKIDTAR